MPLKKGEGREGSLSLSKRLPMSAMLFNPHSNSVGAYERVVDWTKDNARKAMFCRGPLRLVGAPCKRFVLDLEST